MDLLTARRISAGLIAAGFIAGASTMAAAQDRGLYLGAEAGVNILPNMNTGTNNPPGLKVKSDAGYGVGGSVGYGWGNGFRLEEELSWRSNAAHQGVTRAGTFSADGAVASLAAMTNVYYDFLNNSRWTPYVGAGIGAVDVQANSLKVNGANVSNDDDWAFGYQGIAGVSYAVTDALSLKGDYHYLAAQKVSLAESGAFAGNALKPYYTSHAVMIGFTYNLDQPAPPPAPAPMAAAPPPPPPPPPPPAAAPLPKSYMVFFDFDKSDIKSEANAVLQSVAANSKTLNVVKIDATGHTDTVGSDAYNQRLSIRRAEAVKTALINLGVPAAEIVVVGKGKSDPLVQTGDGVREPRNRRVEIVFE